MPNSGTEPARARIDSQPIDDAWFDEDENYLGEHHGQDELTALARVRGVRVTEDELRSLPYDVTPGGELLARCGLS